MQCQVKGTSHELPWFSSVMYNLTTSADDKEQFRVSWPPRDSSLAHRAFVRQHPLRVGSSTSQSLCCQPWLGSHCSQGILCSQSLGST